MQTALKGAAEVPLAIASLCVDTLDLTPAIADKGNVNVVSDAATAAHLAFAALHCALVNVNINLKFLKDSAYVAEGREKVEALTAVAQKSFDAASARMYTDTGHSDMSAQFLNGRQRAKELQADLQTKFAQIAGETGAPPTLAALQVGTDEAASGYMRAIRRACRGVGVAFRPVELLHDSSQRDVEAALAALNDDAAVHGIMVLEPLPQQIDDSSLVDGLDPAKDVDGVHPLNAGRLAAQRQPYFVPATPAGGIQLLEDAGVAFKGKKAVVIGRSDIVGKPMALLLLHGTAR